MEQPVWHVAAEKVPEAATRSFKAPSGLSSAPARNVPLGRREYVWCLTATPTRDVCYCVARRTAQHRQLQGATTPAGFWFRGFKTPTPLRGLRRHAKSRPTEDYRHTDFVELTAPLLTPAALPIVFNDCGSALNLGMFPPEANSP